MAHIPVLLQEVVHWTQPQRARVCIDGTVGGAGHTTALVTHMVPGSTYIGFDIDQSAITAGISSIAEYADSHHINYQFIHNSFDHIAQYVQDGAIPSPDAVLLDLGWSTNQFENSERGFSFRIDGPLDMRLAYPAKPGSLTAADIVNTESEDFLTDLFAELGEDPYARKIAIAIVNARTQSPIVRTIQLARIVESVVPHRGKTHPATQVFQALRIAVNAELSVLRSAISGIQQVLSPGGRLCIITFHSIEDRIVKQLFAESQSNGLGIVLTKHAIAPNFAERKQNPRSRSAHLRVWQKSSTS